MGTKYPRIYAMLKRAGHDPLGALRVLIDASRGDSFAIGWIRALRRVTP